MTRMSDLCDIACDRCFMWKPGTEPLTKKQRSLLKQEGWSVRRNDQHQLEDICPACNGTHPAYWRFQ